MKILHVNYFDSSTGSGIAANRMHCALCNAGIDSYMLVVDKKTTAPKIIQVKKRTRFTVNIYQRLAAKIMQFNRTKNPFPHSLNLFSNGIINEIKKIAPDIIHLHWFGGEMLSIRQLARLPYPLVMTPHDSWIFCGSEHHPDILQQSVRWRDGYLRTNRPAGDRGIDIDRYIWQKKMKYWKNLNIHFLPLNNWMRDMIERSALFSGSSCTVVPNCIDLDLFSPGNKAEARKKWNIPKDTKVILFGAQDVDQPLKGMKYLVESLNKIKNKSNIVLLVYGKCKITSQIIAGLPVIHCGIIKKEYEMAELYRAADVFVCPSIIDNFPNTILEATACGVPSVAFRTGGIPEMIRHKETGYLCEPYNTDEMANGIEYSLTHFQAIMGNVRDFAVKHFSQKAVTEKLLIVYKTLLKS